MRRSCNTQRNMFCRQYVGAQILLRQDDATKPAGCFRVQKRCKNEAHSHCRLVRLPSASGRVPDSWLELKLLCMHDTAGRHARPLGRPRA